MNIKLLQLFLVFIFVVSCSNLKLKNKSNNIEGIVTVTKYNIPIQCKLSFYHKNKLITNVVTDINGKFIINIKEKYLNKENTLIIEPKEKSALKDTLVAGTRIVTIQALNLEPDTLKVTNFNQINKINFKKFTLFEIEKINSH
ncbi:MAG TPA: hypothetical protein EYG85_00465 [Crocinitomix sp.]|nr:hypothetical protein [Crocinitomix sp.]